MLHVFLLLGVLDPSGLHQSGMPREFFLMFSAVDESLSWYLDENIEEFYSGNASLKEDAAFQNSNNLHCKLLCFRQQRHFFLTLCYLDSYNFSQEFLGWSLHFFSMSFSKDTMV